MTKLVVTFRDSANAPQKKNDQAYTLRVMPPWQNENFAVISSKKYLPTHAIWILSFCIVNFDIICWCTCNYTRSKLWHID